ncbi:hypothetical protein [Synechococcus phage S-B64]|uniref:Uncharacterized protein n=2 Tax=Shandvirus TaxID=2948904 RepID=A0A1Z1LWL1_9CAUD|nr:hypothetical protein KNT63_gp178 [Synechococcus phage S-H35]YP_010095262.1 hypothetical protein KNT88_gp024 [Synechococcus phage S-B64]ARW57058.1 hypothetical protein [Synechococcus phage S-H35]AWD90060.1 hypothetical protein [Synechococcus phage S-B64]
MPREWNTSFREPWNPIIKKCLDGVDLHNKLYFESQDTFHLNQADLLRQYVSRLKTWIHNTEPEGFHRKENYGSDDTPQSEELLQFPSDQHR